MSALGKLRYKIRRIFRGFCRFDESTQAVFFLSTGRTGTAFLADTLGLFPGVKAVHEALPKLYGVRRKVFEGQISDQQLRRVLQSARSGMINEAAKGGDLYVESSAFLSFFTPVLSQMLPKAKFVFVTRHPGPFVRSGMRRGWYKDHPQDRSRLRPTPSHIPAYHNWSDWSRFQKICWLWGEYNSYCLKCIEEIDSSRLIRIKIEDIWKGDESEIKKLLDLAGLPTDDSVLAAVKDSRPKNVQTENDFPHYDFWTEEQKSELFEIAGPIMKELGYESGDN